MKGLKGKTRINGISDPPVEAAEKNTDAPKTLNFPSESTETKRYKFSGRPPMKGIKGKTRINEIRDPPRRRPRTRGLKGKTRTGGLRTPADRPASKRYKTRYKCPLFGLDPIISRARAPKTKRHFSGHPRIKGLRSKTRINGQRPPAGRASRAHGRPRLRELRSKTRI